MSLQRVCVFCGSKPGRRPAYTDAARAMARACAERGIGLVYGGASVGTMGVLADAALAADGEVVGVIPQALVDKEVAHAGLTELQIVDSMHARKAQMAALSDAFAVLPGGFGTLDELFEMLTWTQLGLQAKPCGLLNVDGFFDALLAYLDHATAEGFVRAAHRELLTAASTPGALLDRLGAQPVPSGPQWIDRSDV